jgi:hypothetical protein
MATKTDTPQFAVTFDEPDKGQRTKRPWHELYPDACAFVDGTIDAFLNTFGKEDKGYTRKLTDYVVPLERDSEHPNMRAVRLINDRCDSRKVNCHAVIKSGNVHMVIGKRVVKTRAKRNAAADNGTAAE